jgi:uncharacterized membrane-anchored protein YitT (DUF2179 family)
MEFKSRRKPIIDYIYMIIGTTFLAIAINLFLDPLELVTGGVTGIAIIIKALTVDIWAGGIPIWFTNIVILAVLLGVLWLVLDLVLFF